MGWHALEAAIAIALIENIQREDLNPVEEAGALQRLIDEFGMTHQRVAEAVGRSRAAVTNLLRLLSLSEDVRKMLENASMDMGHARALLALVRTALAPLRKVAHGGDDALELLAGRRTIPTIEPPALHVA